MAIHDATAIPTLYVLIENTLTPLSESFNDYMLGYQDDWVLTPYEDLPNNFDDESIIHECMQTGKLTIITIPE